MMKILNPFFRVFTHLVFFFFTFEQAFGEIMPPLQSPQTSASPEVKSETPEGLQPTFAQVLTSLDFLSTQNSTLKPVENSVSKKVQESKEADQNAAPIKTFSSSTLQSLNNELRITHYNPRFINNQLTAFELTFQHSPSITGFIVQYTDNLAGSWKTVLNAQTGKPLIRPTDSSGKTSWLDDGTLTGLLGRNRFYRIIAADYVPIETISIQGQTITKDTLWKRGTYLIQGDVLVASGTTLTIEAGTVLKFAKDINLNVLGTLNAFGDEKNLITFTSNAQKPQAGDWASIHIEGAEAAGSKIGYWNIEYSKFGLLIFHSSLFAEHIMGTHNVQAITVQDNSNAVLRDLTLSGNMGGLVIFGSSPTVLNSKIFNNNLGVALFESSGITPNPNINHSAIYSNSEFGVVLDRAFANPNAVINFKENWWGTMDVSSINTAISDHWDAATKPFIDYSGFLDAENGRRVSGNFVSGTLTKDTVWRANDGPIIVTNDITVPLGVTLKIEPGTVIKFVKNSALRINGVLNARGTDDRKIIFTSLEATPKKSDWTGIILTGANASASQITYAKIEYSKFGIGMTDTSPTISHVTSLLNAQGFTMTGNSAPNLTHVVTSNNDYGLALFGSHPFITNSQVINNGAGIYLSPSKGVDPKPVMSRSSIYNNTEYNLELAGSFSDPSAKINFMSNWWGTTEQNSIASKITDHSDLSSLPYTDYSSFLISDPAALGSSLSSPSLSALPQATRQNHIILSGSKLPNTSIWINGIEMVPLGTSTIWQTVFPLSYEGKNYFSMTNRDAAGTESRAISAAVVLDQTGPVPPELAAFNVLRTNHQKQTIYGSKEPGTAIMINGTEMVPSDGKNTWSAQVVLSKGNNIFSIAARDDVGNIGAPATFTVERNDETRLSSLSYSIGEMTNQSKPVISGTKQQGSWLKILSAKTNQVVLDIPANISGEWNGELPLPNEGLNEFYLLSEEQDIKGNLVEKRIPLRMTRDTIIPVIPTAIPDTVSTAKPLVFVSGNKESGTAIWINGKEVISADASSVWTTSILLKNQRMNPFDITAVDAAGNASGIRHFEIERTSLTPNKPVLNSPFILSNKATYAFSGSKDAGTGIMFNEKVLLPVDNKTIWNVNVSLEDLGWNPFHITAVSSEGVQSNEEFARIYYDTEPPTGIFTINYGAPVTRQSEVTISMDVGDFGNLPIEEMSYSTDGISYSTERFPGFIGAGRTKKITLSKPNEVNDVYVKFKDAAGNWSEPAHESILYESKEAAENFRLTSSPISDTPYYVLEYQFQNKKFSESIFSLLPGKNYHRVTQRDLTGKEYTKIFAIEHTSNREQAVYFDYDANGNRSQQSDENGAKTQYFYDPQNRLITTAYADGQFVHFDYDANGNRISMTDSNGKTEYKYDWLNRLTQMTDPKGRKLAYDYDLAGNIIKIVYPDGLEIRYKYDRNNYLTEVTDDSGITKYEYNDAGDVRLKVLPNGIRSQYAYDNAGRLKEIRNEKSNGASVSFIPYEYDASGNIKKCGLTEYKYDSLGRVIEAKSSLRFLILPPSTYREENFKISYTYDASGNRLSKTTEDWDSDLAFLKKMETLYYKYGPENRLERIGKTLSQTADDEIFYYDPRGNLAMRSKPGETILYTYDAANRLIQVDNGKQIVQYLYDGDSNRIGKIVDGVRTDYVTDSNRAISQVVQEINAQTDAITKTYTIGNERIQVKDASSGRGFYLTDAIGSITEVMKTDQQYGSVYEYNPFGGHSDTLFQGDDENSTNNFRFAGEQYDPETGLYYLRNRYYDPSTGRFISKDPVIGDFNSTQSFNPYIYVQNNPINAVDPLGLFPGFPDPANPPSGWISIGGGKWRDPKTGEVWSWHPDKGGAHGGDHWDIGGPKPPKGGKGPQSWWPLGGEKGPKPSGGERPKPGEKNGGKRNESTTSSYNDWARSLNNSSSSSSRGGILLNKSAELLGENISNITGAVYDPKTQQFILTGTKQDGVVSDVIFNDLVVALKAVFGSIEDSGVTIVDFFTDESGKPRQKIQLFGGVENTEFGQVLINADLVLKKLVIEKDNVTGQPITINIPEYQSILDRLIATGQRPDSIRMWFVPDSMKLIRSEDGTSFQFKESSIQLLTESKANNSAISNPVMEEFVQFLTSHYGEFSKRFPELERMRQLAKAVSIARFIKDNNIPIDLSWLDSYELPDVITETSTPVLKNEKGGFILQGGVIFELLNQYLPDSGGKTGDLSSAILNAKTTDTTASMKVKVGNDSLQGVALSTNPTQQDSNLRWNEDDMSLTTPGDLELNFMRFYDSLDSTKTSLGQGWQFLPYAIHFNRPAYVNSTYGEGTTINGLREGTATFVNRSTGQEVVFYSTLQASKNGLAGVDSATLLPSYIPVAESDGSVFRVDSNRNYFLTQPDGSLMKFDTNGNLTQMSDPEGHSISYRYTDGRLTNITDFLDRTIKLTYNNQGQLSRVQSPLNYGIVYEYDNKGNLASVFNEKTKQRTQYFYDVDHRINKMIDPSGRTLLQSDLDVMGRSTAQEDHRGNILKITRSADNQIVTTTDPITGKKIIEEYDGLHRLVKKTDYLGHSIENAYLFYERKPFSITDSKGFTTYFFYDQNHNVTDIFDFESNVHQTFKYDEHNNLLEATDRNGVMTRYVYDEKENLLKEIHRPISETKIAIIRFNYDENRQIKSFIDANGYERSFDRDKFGNITAIIAGGQNDFTQDYDEFFRVSSTRDEEGREIHLKYNELDLQTEIKNAYGQTVLTYDQLGHKTSITDAEGRLTKFVYDPKTGDLLTTLQRLANDRWAESKYTYDRFGNVTSITDPNGAKTTFQYDDLGRLTRRGKDPSEIEFQFVVVYGAAGGTEAIVVAPASKMIDRIILRYRPKGQEDYTTVQYQDLFSNQLVEKLKGLEPNTVYEYKVEAYDLFGKRAIYPTQTFKTGARSVDEPYVIKNQITTIGANDIQLALNLAAGTFDGKVLMEVVPVAGGASLSREETLRPDSDNTIAITGLVPNTEYVYTLSTQNKAGNAVFKKTADPIYFKTRDSKDLTGSVVEELTLAQLLAHEAVFHLRTNEALAKAEIELIPDQGAPVVVTHYTPGQDRDLSVEGLKPGMRYTYVMKLTDFSGNMTQTKSQVLTTPLLQTDPVQILHQQPIEVWSDEAKIRIETNGELAEVIVSLIPLDTKIPQEIRFDALSGSIQELLLKGLRPGTDYYYSVTVKDKSGYITKSSELIQIHTRAL
ncbi:MAG: hypothetical protein EXS63_03865 [Candidatus Omnitrophica bacterium]|nr:hypothetical protein [Candidatus Omnitrophota bacterium]